ncbi:MAG: hypothetical protein EZS28_045915, partial [Streblomastix strix]
MDNGVEQLSVDESSDESKSDHFSQDNDLEERNHQEFDDFQLENEEDIEELFVQNKSTDEEDKLVEKSDDDNEQDKENIIDGDSDSDGIEPDAEVMKLHQEKLNTPRKIDLKELEKIKQEEIAIKRMQEIRELELLQKIEESKQLKVSESDLISPIDKTQGLEFFMKGVEMNEQQKNELETRKQQLVEDKQQQKGEQTAEEQEQDEQT